MATIRSYRVQLTPAKIENGAISFMLYDPGTKYYEVTASSMAELQGNVRALVVNDFKQTAACYVSLTNHNERKPAGFDKATREIQTLRYMAPESDSLAWIDDPEQAAILDRAVVQTFTPCE